MKQYSLDEQIDIINLGIKKIHEYTGVKPIAHRAGGYGINGDTFKALRETGILIDSSYFHNHPVCEFKAGTYNKVFTEFGVLEIPVTMYKVLTFGGSPKIGTKNPSTLSRSAIKFDLKYGKAEVDEILECVKKSRRNDIIVLFLHSSNFVFRLYNMKKRTYLYYTIDRKAIQDFDRLIASLAANDKCQFVNFADLDFDFCETDKIITVKRHLSVFCKTKELCANFLLSKLNLYRL